jgi:hypothetical protein
LLLAALSLLTPSPGQALDVSFTVTLPSTAADTTWLPPSERDSPADSILVSCSEPGEPIADLDSLFLYGHPANGGERRRVAGYSVRTLEGRSYDIGPLSLPWMGGHFDVTTKRLGSKESCPGNRVYVGTVTGVEPEPVVVKRDEPIYDVHGRRVAKVKASGVYWRKGRIVHVK